MDGQAIHVIIVPLPTCVVQRLQCAADNFNMPHFRKPTTIPEIVAALTVISCQLDDDTIDDAVTELRGLDDGDVLEVTD